ncbi:MAG: D-sedoheptulose 7-phosphate isomerase [Candidatus Omnitrophica bacterium]|nr:D-sedoheptulose 7-phosphate isomerase [Candidatus Omnitrophota bacterium]
MDNLILTSFNSHKKALTFLENQLNSVKEIANLCLDSLKNKGKIIFMGNGGSAADSQHFAAELVGRFKKNREALAAIALTTDTSIITALANDFGYDVIFSRQIEALAQPNDIVIGISTSGKSENIIQAIKKAKEIGTKTVGFLGNNGGSLKELVDISITIPSADTPRIQEMHNLAGHIICDIIENQLFPNE